MSLNRLPSVFRRNSGTSPNGNLVNGSASKDNSTAPVQVIKDFREQARKGLPVDLSSVASVIDALKNTDGIDDRKFLLEYGLTFVSRLDDGSFRQSLQNKIVQLLYDDLGHPPATSIGSYSWRTADGSSNNIDLPHLGQAGTPYARSVQQSHSLPRDQLPDSGLVFDTLLKREGFVKHPAGLSSLMFSFAALVIHTVFRTSHSNVSVNETSSYVDLSPLYGHNQEAQNGVRKRDGRGLLLPDVFAEDRLLLLPPAVCALLVLFNRNHNYIAKKLLEINERGTFIDPAELSPDIPVQKARLLAQEEELFQTARLINCGWFASVVFSDYFSCILGLIRGGNSWSLNPFGEIRTEDQSVFERGKGNVCSVEFNCLYRWHATTSVEDEQWVNKVFSEIFDGKAPEDVTAAEFKQAAIKIQEMRPDIQHWTFGSLKRQADGSFDDDDLANLLHNATEHPAAAFRARGTPASMRLHEVMGIEQNRRWGVCSLNDFRTYLRLKPYKSFKEWNSDPAIADAAEALYGDIENLELYVGLQAEEAKPVMDGAGLCPGYTISRAILSDAISLTRGDRFFTHDYTPFNLTAWGFADCQRDSNAFGFGSTLGRLFLRTLPNNYTENSVYTFFPLMTPDAMTTHLTKMDILDQYDLTRPKPRPKVQTTRDYVQVAEILKNKDGFVTEYAGRAARVIRGKGFYTVEGEGEQEKVYRILADSTETIDDIGRFFHDTTRNLIRENAFTLVGGKTHGVDLVRNVLRHVPVYWAATEIAGIQLKTKDHPHGAYTPAQLFEVLGEIYSFIFLEVEASKVMVLQGKVRSHVSDLLGHIKRHLNGTPGQRLSISGIVGTVSSVFTKSKRSYQHHELLKRLSSLGKSNDELANTVLALMVGSTIELTLALTDMINLYLDSDKVAEIRALAKSSDVKTQLDGYVYEALRLDPTFQGCYRVAAKDLSVANVFVKKDERLFLDVSHANLNESVFSDATTVDIARGGKGYLHGDGLFAHIGEPLTVKIMAQVLRAVFAHDHLRRAPGQSGVLKRFQEYSRPELRYAYLDQAQCISAWPTTLIVQFDAQ